MRYELLDKPDFGMVKVTFDAAGEQILTEPSAMVARDSGVEMKTSMQGGLLSAAKRKLLGGESIFQNTFTSSAPGETLWLAPAPEGDVEALELDGTHGVFLQSGAYMASASTVTLDTKWGGAKGFFSGTGLFLLKCGGSGPLFFNCYGGIHTVDVGPDGYVCDNNHVVGFTEGLEYRIQPVGGMKSYLFSGEWLVCRFSGHGRLYISTRNAASLATFLHPFRPVQRGG